VYVVAMMTQELVPGDIISLKAGDKVPADIRLFDVNEGAWARRRLD
jgi:magnesium-transporting ATPase (P-type)